LDWALLSFLQTKEMVSIKRLRLKILCKEYGVSDEMAQEILDDTKDIDKRLGGVS